MIYELSHGRRIVGYFLGIHRAIDSPRYLSAGRYIIAGCTIEENHIFARMVGVDEWREFHNGVT